MVELCVQLFDNLRVKTNMNAMLLMIVNAPWPTITSKTNRISANFDRYFSDVFDVSFLLKERMLTFGRHQNQESVPATITDVGFSGGLTIQGAAAFLWVSWLSQTPDKIR